MILSARDTEQAILFTRWNTSMAIGLIFFGTLEVGQLGFGVLLLVFSPTSDTVEVGIAITLLGLLGSGLFFGTAWHQLTHKIWLVLLADRLQYRVGKRVRGEIHYRDVDQIALFRSWFGALCLGVRLRAAERFEREWPRLGRQRAFWQRWGFDFAMMTRAAAEPPERILETALRLLELFRASAAEGSEG